MNTENEIIRRGRCVRPGTTVLYLGVLLWFLFLGLSPLGAQAGAAAPAPEAETSLVITPEDAGESPQGTPGELQTGVGVWDVIRMILILGIVVALVYAFLYFMKKASKIGTTSLEGVKVLGSQVLTGNRVLYVVDVAGEVLLLGAGDASVTLIKEITDPEVRDSLRLQASRQQTTSLTFQEILKRFTPLKGSDGKEGTLSADSGKSSVDFLKKQRERLKKL